MGSARIFLFKPFARQFEMFIAENAAVNIVLPSFYDNFYGLNRKERFKSIMANFIAIFAIAFHSF